MFPCDTVFLFSLPTLLVSWLVGLGVWRSSFSILLLYGFESNIKFGNPKRHNDAVRSHDTSVIGSAHVADDLTSRAVVQSCCSVMQRPSSNSRMTQLAQGYCRATWEHGMKLSCIS